MHSSSDTAQSGSGIRILVQGQNNQRSCPIEIHFVQVPEDRLRSIRMVITVCIVDLSEGEHEPALLPLIKVPERHATSYCNPPSVPKNIQVYLRSQNAVSRSSRLYPERLSPFCILMIWSPSDVPKRDVTRQQQQHLPSFQEKVEGSLSTSRPTPYPANLCRTTVQD
jgi:hypothetical protein